MTHSNDFWLKYVESVKPERAIKFWEWIHYGMSGESAAYRALEGIMYAHKAAIDEASAKCRK